MKTSLAPSDFPAAARKALDGEQPVEARSVADVVADQLSSEKAERAAAAANETLYASVSKMERLRR